MKCKKGILLFGMLLFFIVACENQKKEQQQTLRKVKVEKLQKATAILRKDFSGIVKEAREVNLAFRVAGPIKTINVKEGDYVKKGTLLAQIDPRDYQIQMDVTQAEYDKVITETKRVAELYKRKSIAEVDYQKAMAGEKMISAKLAHSKHQLNDTKLYAPFSGYIQTVKYETGEMVNTGMTIASLIDMDYFEIEVDIPSSLFVLKNAFTTFSCKQNELNIKEIPISLSSYNVKANNNQLYKLYFRLDPDSDKRLAPGMSVQVFIDYNSTTENPYHVPIKAVFNENNQAYVWVYKPISETVEKRKVTTAALYGEGRISIVDGLQSDDLIVVAGVHVLKENQKVKIMQAVSETNIGGVL